MVRFICDCSNLYSLIECNLFICLCEPYELRLLFIYLADFRCSIGLPVCSYPGWALIYVQSQVTRTIRCTQVIFFFVRIAFAVKVESVTHTHSEIPKYHTKKCEMAKTKASHCKCHPMAFLTRQTVFYSPFHIDSLWLTMYAQHRVHKSFNYVSRDCCTTLTTPISDEIHYIVE